MSLSLAKVGSSAPANVEALRDAIPDYAKDIKLNLGTLLTPEGAPDLTQAQIYCVALACAYATRQHGVVSALLGEVEGKIDDAAKNAAKSAASIMAMNNIYYRFLHLVGKEDFKKMPAKLRMNILANPGVPKIDFELMSLAVSAINGCGMCIEAHTHALEKIGCSLLGIQSAIRIAAVINGAAQVQFIE